MKSLLAAAPPSAATALLQEQQGPGRAKPTPEEVYSSMAGGQFPAAGPDWKVKWGGGDWLKHYTLHTKSPELMLVLQPFKQLALDPLPTTNRGGVRPVLETSALPAPCLPRIW